MQAAVGDRLIVRSRQAGSPARTGEIVEVHGMEGRPPYVVRWDNGHQSTFVPSSDTVVEHHPAPGAA